ncbi:flagellar motor switch protein FliG [Palleronia salina]|uniref:Flagellar motor switch protein FliG n=1 Tax=Palleronia salina TaxID=313368 RepID=A0A1M6CYS3_9RHOB|nr:flagellar motor switch protein FliG [Palleronia salina]SHI66001.1 flagellar motor switch protein FliG [Palleronia salina]
MSTAVATRAGTEPIKLGNRTLKGPTKAAIVFLCLGEKVGSELMRKLDATDIELITRAMTNLGSIPSDVVEAVLGEFIARAAEGSRAVVGSIASAEAMLKSFLPEDEVANILKSAGGKPGEGDIWRRFAALNENVIANYLKGEHDQTVAAILNNVDTSVAAKVLPLLGPERMYDVAERMIVLEPLTIQVMRQIEETLKEDIMSEGTSGSASQNQQRMAELFNKLDIAAFEDLSEQLDARIPETFEAIKKRMFVFEDFSRLPATDLALVMRQLDGDQLPLALRGAKKELRDQMLECLPQRSRQMLLDEMAQMGPARGRDVRAAQSAMIETAKNMADEGTIELPKAGEEEDEFFE